MTPVVRCLLACDRVSRTIRAGRSDLFGVFHSVSLLLPAFLSFAVFYVITGVDQATDVTLSFIDPAGEVLGAGPVTVPAVGPLAVVQGMGSFDVKVVRAGVHRLMIEHAGQLLAEQPILVGEGRHRVREDATPIPAGAAGDRPPARVRRRRTGAGVGRGEGRAGVGISTLQWGPVGLQSPRDRLGG